MTKNLYFPVAFLCLLTSTCFAGEYIIKVDRVTGAFVKQGPAIPGITYIYPDDRAYDQRTGTFMFPSALITHSLYSMDVSNGTVVNSPVIGDLWLFQFDNTFGVLYGMEQHTAANTKQFVSIDPATGITTAIGNPFPGSSVPGGGPCTYDQKNHIYYFFDYPNKLVGIDVTTGNVVSSPALLMPFGETLGAFVYDSTNATMYALVGNTVMNWYFLSTINPTTGAVSHMGWGTNHLRLGSASDIDEVNQQFVSVYSSPDSGGYMIATLDIATGDLLHNKLVQPFTAGQDNVFSVKCDKASRELYCIHWESERTELPTYAVTNRSVVYPNPVRGSATVACSNPEGEERKLEVYNSLGQIQATISDITADKVQVNVEDLQAGVYYYQIKNKKEIVSSGRMIVE